MCVSAGTVRGLCGGELGGECSAGLKCGGGGVHEGAALGEGGRAEGTEVP